MEINKKNWVYTLGMSLLSLIIPMAVLLAIVNTQSNNKNPLGGLRIAPGKFLALDENLLLENPRNRDLITAESLNRNICILALSNPEIQPQLKSSTEEGAINMMSEHFGEDTTKIKESLKRYNISWQTKLGTWGIFTPPYSTIQKEEGSQVPSFGYVQLKDGAANTRFQTEKILNDAIIIYRNENPDTVKEPSLEELSIISLKKGLTTPEGIPILLGACEVLKIKYDANTKLFLSQPTKENLKKWLKWIQ